MNNADKLLADQVCELIAQRPITTCAYSLTRALKVPKTKLVRVCKEAGITIPKITSKRLRASISRMVYQQYKGYVINPKHEARAA